MAQTAGGTYYAASSELVSSWPATSLDLANQLESRFAAKANLASPALTGTPTAPTAASGTNTTQIATTAFVQANGGMTLIAESTASGSAVSFSSLLTGYTAYRLVGYCENGSTSQTLLRLRQTSTDVTSGIYNATLVSASGSSVSAASLTTDTSWGLTVSSGATSLHTFDVLLLDTASAYAKVQWQAGTGTPTSRLGTGWINNAANVNGLTIYPSSGTFSGGKFSLYGLK